MPATSSLTIAAATPADTDAILALLRAADLPVDDLEPAALPTFLVARAGERIAGAVALDASDGVALLRSLVVDRARRGSGLGKRLLEAAERHAAATRVHTLYLLTTGAGAFFRRAGYADTERAAAPARIAATPQFAGLCPASSDFLSKALPPQRS